MNRENGKNNARKSRSWADIGASSDLSTRLGTSSSHSPRVSTTLTCFGHVAPQSQQAVAASVVLREPEALTRTFALRHQPSSASASTAQSTDQPAEAASITPAIAIATTAR